MKSAEYKFPFPITYEARELIIYLLSYDPKTRCTLQEIKSHPFVTFQEPENQNEHDTSNILILSTLQNSDSSGEGSTNTSSLQNTTENKTKPFNPKNKPFTPQKPMGLTDFRKKELQLKKYHSAINVRTKPFTSKASNPIPLINLDQSSSEKENKQQNLNLSAIMGKQYENKLSNHNKEALNKTQIQNSTKKNPQSNRYRSGANIQTQQQINTHYRHHSTSRPRGHHQREKENSCLNKSQIEKRREEEETKGIKEQRIKSDFKYWLKPINTIRLKPLTHNCGGGAGLIKILKNGWVEKEIAKRTKIMSVSPNGQRVIRIFKLQIILKSKLIENLEVEYTLDKLPEKYFPVYQYCSQIVEVARSKTAKITLISSNAKCNFMENSPNPNFEIKFQSGVKIIYQLHSTKADIVTKDGTHLQINPFQDLEHLEMDQQNNVNAMFKCIRRCSELEKAEQSKPNPMFPITITQK